MSLDDRVRTALEGFRDVRETEVPGGLEFEWDGDPLVRVIDGELVVRSGDGWTAVTGDLQHAVHRAAEVVLAECVVRWHGQLREGGDDGFQAMLGLTHHDPEREQLQRLLLDRTHDPKFRQLAVTCLGHVGRMDGEVLPEVLTRLRELLDDPDLEGYAENALGDIGIECHPFHLSETSPPWVVFAPPGDGEVARQLAALAAAGGIVLRLDGREMRTEQELFRVFARELDFPSYFGRNWDALVDCLKHLHPAWPHPKDLAVVISHAELLPRLPLFVQCATEALEYANFPVDADGDPEPDVDSFAFHIVLESATADVPMRPSR